MSILDGRNVANQLLDQLKTEVEQLKKRHIQPQLAVILIGENPASISYVRQKNLAAKRVGILSKQVNLEEKINEENLLRKIAELNIDPKIHGILVQLPLPKHINEQKIILAINPDKDVDGFHPVNLGALFASFQMSEPLINTDYADPPQRTGFTEKKNTKPQSLIIQQTKNQLARKPENQKTSFPPATPAGILYLLDYYKIPLKGAEIVIVGHSNIVGKPLAIMLLNRGATVTVCHIHTKNLKAHTQKADILISATGVPHLITADHVKEKAVVIDVGCSKIPPPTPLLKKGKPKEKLVGDVDFDTVSKKTTWISPVPGGVGPMTVASLMVNVVRATLIGNR